MARAHTVYTATCYRCGERFDVGVRAVTVRCPKCCQGLQLQDVIVLKGFNGSKAQTCGTVQVRRKARLVASTVEAGAGVQVLGSLAGNVTTAGPMHIGPYGRFKGDCKAAALIVDYGARIDGGYFEIAGAAPASGDVSSDDPAR